MSARDRIQRSDHVDLKIRNLAALALNAHPEMVPSSFAIGAVGGYGRGELFPGSDLDFIIITETDPESFQPFVQSLLYPLWDEGVKVDYSVRTHQQTVELARSDIKVLIGLLDLRHIAGNSELIAKLGSESAQLWRDGRDRWIPRLRALMEEQHRRAGDVAYLLEPDLKESRGGLRDITVLRALSKLEGIEIPLEKVESAEQILRDAREALHEVSGRTKDILLFQEQDKVAQRLGYGDADRLISDISHSARAISYLLNHALSQSQSRQPERFTLFRKKTQRVEIARGVVVSDGVVAIEEGADLSGDPVLPLRWAASAAQAGLQLSYASAADIVRQLSAGQGVLASPWPREAREQLVSLLGAGRASLPIIEVLEQEGIFHLYLPEWERVRSLPQRNALHRHTVDRHMVETALCAASYTRKVKRPDLLLIAALFHDIGKGGTEDHSMVGAELMKPLAARMGFSEDESETLVMLVREHLLLPEIATRRDLDDPATIEYVAERVPRDLELLKYLSFADGEATGKAAWSDWKARLVTTLVEKVRHVQAGNLIEPEPLVESERDVRELEVELENRGAEIVITVASPDSPGLLSITAGVLSNARLNVRSARTKTVGRVAYMRWIVEPDTHAPVPEVAALRSQIVQSLAGTFDLNRRIEERKRAYAALPSIPVPAPRVEIIDGGATDATIIEIRSHDRPALLFTIGDAITKSRIDIRAAIVSTLGAEAIDTLYLTEIDGGALTQARANEVRDVISGLL